MSVVERVRVEMDNIGVEVVDVISGYGEATMLLRGKGNKRLASHSVPSGVLSTADEALYVDQAVTSIKQQLSTKTGRWPDAPSN